MEQEQQKTIVELVAETEAKPILNTSAAVQFSPTMESTNLVPIKEDEVQLILAADNPLTMECTDLVPIASTDDSCRLKPALPGSFGWEAAPPGGNAQPWRKKRSSPVKKKTLPVGLPDNIQSYAGFRSRLAAHLIDCLVVAVLGSFLTGFLTVIPVLTVSSTPTPVDHWTMLYFFGLFEYALCTAIPVLSSFLAPLMILPLAERSMPGVIYPLFISLAFGPPIVDLLYRSIMESSVNQATIGKKLMKIYVASETGKRLKFSQALYRNLLKLVSALTLMIGFLPLATGQRRQTLHDKLTKTFVIKEICAPSSVPKTKIETIGDAG